MSDIPLSLYVHFPWCAKKCPYCDFNSHEIRGDIPERDYIDKLIADLDQSLRNENRTEVTSIFLGGGTPSLFSASGMSSLIEAIGARLNIDDIEITVEANPGTFDQAHFKGYVDAGINRISLGAQSFADESLKALGRIHLSKDTFSAFDGARRAGFERINLDIMYGLPGQNLDAALRDLETAVSLTPEHISWYQLTIEPNTYFYSHPPALPDEDGTYEMTEAGVQLLHDKGYSRYEISAYATAGEEAVHNLNYWQFGDYLGIGAGAHGKVTRNNRICRTSMTRAPADYLRALNMTVNQVPEDEIDLEFLMNALRLTEGFSADLFEARTCRNFSNLDEFIRRGTEKGLIEDRHDRWVRPTPSGMRYLNDLLILL